jgi:hypothetical protein
MNRGKRLVKGVVLLGGLGVIAAALAGTQPASAQPYPGGTTPTPLVIRGTDPAAAPPPPAKDAPPTVLRGSPLVAAQPAAVQYACPSGYNYDATYGCMTPGYAYSPYDYGYWPFYGFPDVASGGRGFRHSRAHGIGRGFAPRSGHDVAGDSHQGFARAGGLGHR